MKLIIGSSSIELQRNLSKQFSLLKDLVDIVFCSTHTEIMQQTQALNPPIVIVDYDLQDGKGSATIQQLRNTGVSLLIICFYQRNEISPHSHHIGSCADFMINIQKEFDLLIKLVESILRHQHSKLIVK